MSFKKLDDYVGQRDKFVYPADNIDPKLKLKKEYYIAYNNALLADYCNNFCELPYAFFKNNRTFRELYTYSIGAQSMDKIKNQILGAKKKNQKTGLYATKMNISWQSLNVLPKMFDMLREKNMRQDYDVDSFCVDDDSIQTKNADQKVLMYMVHPATQAIRSATTPESQVASPPVPEGVQDPQQLGLETQEDVQLYFDCGAYTLQREIASIAACNKTKLVSNHKVIQDGQFDDLIRYGIAGGKMEIDPVSKVVKERRVEIYNPELDRCPLILPYSSNNNFDNLSKCAEFRTMTIADLRKECPELTGAQLLYIAQCFSYLNPAYSNLVGGSGWYAANNGAFDSSGSYSLDPINKCKILVLDSQWLSIDIEYYLKNGERTVFKSVEFGTDISNDRKRKGDRIIQKKVVKKYASKWVVGTDILLKFGIDEDIVYYGPDGNKCPSLDYFFTKTGSMSLVERVIAIQDDIDLANTKLRNTLATAIPAPRMVIQTGLLDNVFLNNIKQQPEDNMDVFKELGYLFVNAVDDNGKPIFSNSKMVDFMTLGIAEDINVFSGQILTGINNMKETLGLFDNTNPNPYNGFKKTELALQSSNAALYPTFNCYQYLFESMMTDCVKKWQIIARDNKINLNYSPLGNKNLRTLALDSAFTNADYNIKMSLGSTQDELKAMMDDINQLKAMGLQTNFQQGITVSEWLYLKEKIMSGNAKEAQYVMAKIEAKKMALKQQIDEKNQQATFAGQQQSAQIAEQAKQITAQIQGAEDRKTALVQEAQKRKTGATTAYLKSIADPTNENNGEVYSKMMQEADQEIAPVITQDQQAAQQLSGNTGQPATEQPGNSQAA